MMNQDTQLQCEENGKNSVHLPADSLQYETNSSIPQVYNVPPPNMYIPPYLHYSGNCSTNFTTIQHTNVLVPPFPPPDFQNSSFPSPVSFPQPFSQPPTIPPPPPPPPPIMNIPLSFEFEMQGPCNSQQAFVSIPLASEFEGKKFQNKECSNDALWIENWLSKQNGRAVEMTSEKPIKISEAKESFKKCINLLEELEQLKEELQTGCNNMSVASWNSVTQDFINKKGEVAEFILNLPDVTELKKSITKRCRKRECQNRRREKWKEYKIIHKEKRQVLHHKIDTWLKSMQETIDKSKREESLKKEADSVLSEVLRKKADGRRQLALVEALLKLRQLRAKSAANRGQHVPTDDGIRFENVAENLKALWDKQLQEYNVEEQGMRVMLSEAVDERDQSQVSSERHILSQWDKLLFGTRRCDFLEFYSSAEKSVEAFINIRQSWDKFIVSNRASMQSNIPVGWVLPSNPSSSSWEALLSSVKLEG